MDEAIRRRLHLIPFSVTIPESERDAQLAPKLSDEWPGILQWAIHGCLEWQRIGLSPPTAVLIATADYLTAEDALGAWIEVRCERDEQAWTPSIELYMSWKSWAEQAGEPTGSQRHFSQKLEGRGFIKERHRGRSRLPFLGPARLQPQMVGGTSWGSNLTGYGFASFSWPAWGHLLDIAMEFGWQPEGTEPSAYHHVGSWNGTYGTNDYQEVTTSDAAALGAALFRASAARRSGTLTERQHELLGNTCLSMIEELAEFASRGNFYIG